jgi:hypothetical protein
MPSRRIFPVAADQPALTRMRLRRRSLVLMVSQASAAALHAGIDCGRLATSSLVSAARPSAPPKFDSKTRLSATTASTVLCFYHDAPVFDHWHPGAIPGPRHDLDQSGK